jgi:hypothetical protein
LNLYDPHCRQIFLGCSHHDGFVRLLEEEMQDSSLLSQITLLQGVPFEKEFETMPFPRAKFGNLFRDSKITIHTNPLPAFRPETPQSPDTAPLTRTTTNSSNTPSIGFTQTVIQKPQPMQKLTWANKAAAAALRPPTPPSRAPSATPVHSTSTIPRNRKGQRIDPPTCAYDKVETDRVKAIKMCNVHYLLKSCPYGKKCTHSHDYKPTKDELEVLKLVARMAPCIHGTGCDDVNCIYGHRCPFPERKDPRRNREDDGGKTCIFGRSCRFDREMHEVDTTAVKTTVIR